jgi:hypothetical protein
MNEKLNCSTEYYEYIHSRVSFEPLIAVFLSLLFHDGLSAACVREYQVGGWLEEAVVAFFKVPSQHLPVGTKENHHTPKFD